MASDVDLEQVEAEGLPLRRQVVVERELLGFVFASGQVDGKKLEVVRGRIGGPGALGQREGVGVLAALNGGNPAI